MGQEKVKKSKKGGWWFFGRDAPTDMVPRPFFDDEEDEANESLLDEDAEMISYEVLNDMGNDEEQDSTNMRDYWTICSTRRAFFCLNSIKHIIPSWKKYHGIAKYLRSVEHTHLFKNRKGTKTSKFNEALIATCQKLQG